MAGLSKLVSILFVVASLSSSPTPASFIPPIVSEQDQEPVAEENTKHGVTQHNSAVVRTTSLKTKSFDYRACLETKIGGRIMKESVDGDPVIVYDDLEKHSQVIDEGLHHGFPNLHSSLDRNEQLHAWEKYLEFAPYNEYRLAEECMGFVEDESVLLLWGKSTVESIDTCLTTVVGTIRSPPAYSTTLRLLPRWRKMIADLPTNLRAVTNECVYSFTGKSDFVEIISNETLPTEETTLEDLRSRCLMGMCFTDDMVGIETEGEEDDDILDFELEYNPAYVPKVKKTHKNCEVYVNRSQRYCLGSVTTFNSRGHLLEHDPDGKNHGNKWGMRKWKRFYEKKEEKIETSVNCTPHLLCALDGEKRDAFANELVERGVSYERVDGIEEKCDSLEQNHKNLLYIGLMNSFCPDVAEIILR